MLHTAPAWSEPENKLKELNVTTKLSLPELDTTKLPDRCQHYLMKCMKKQEYAVKYFCLFADGHGCLGPGYA